ncbi:hypothetical protein EJ07DRAFT_151794 [Lizonia empirigonia]|nr:hypothetical protein EJ07DRAFT_151794 [Lizonia empirigonia]
MECRNILRDWLERTYNVQLPLVPEGLRERREDEVAGGSAVNSSVGTGRDVQVTPMSSMGSENESNEQESSNNPSTSRTPATPETETSDNNPPPSTPILSPPGQPWNRYVALPHPAGPVLGSFPRPAKRPLADTLPGPEAPRRRVHPPPARGDTWTGQRTGRYNAVHASLDRLDALSRELEDIAGPSSRRYSVGLPCERETTGRVCGRWAECAECDRIYVQGVMARVFPPEGARVEGGAGVAGVRESESECEDGGTDEESIDEPITDEELTDVDNDSALAASRDEDDQAAGAYGDAVFGAGNRRVRSLSPRRSRTPRWWRGMQNGGSSG